jgi:hypothetical protein
MKPKECGNWPMISHCSLRSISRLTNADYSLHTVQFRNDLVNESVPKKDGMILIYVLHRGRARGVKREHMPPLNFQKNFLHIVENSLDALFAHSQLQIRDNRNPVTTL